MKKSIVTMTVLPWLLCSFVVANVVSPTCQGKPIGARQLKPADNKPEVSKYGNLLKWSGKRFHKEGYELRYEYIDPRTRKKVVKLVSAFGKGTATGLLPVKTNNNSSPGNTEAVSVKTKDGVLTLTRLFILNRGLEARLIVKTDLQQSVRLLSLIIQGECNKNCCSGGDCIEIKTGQTYCWCGPPDKITKTLQSDVYAIKFSWKDQNTPSGPPSPERPITIVSQYYQ